MNSLAGLQSLEEESKVQTSSTVTILSCSPSLLLDAYKARWTRTGEEMPEILFDKEFRPDACISSVHILWYACIHGKDYPRVTGYGTTIQDAFKDLLSQLCDGPQRWLAKLAVERDEFISKLKENKMAKGKQHSPVKHAMKPSAAIPSPSSFGLLASSPPVSAGPPSQSSNINFTSRPALSKKPTDKIASKPQVAVAGSHQDSKRKSDTLFKNLPAWVLGTKTAGFKSAGGSSSPGFALGFGQSPSSFGNQFLSSVPSVPTPKFGDGIKPCNFTGLFGEKAVLEEARQREKRKEEDMESDEDEEDWEKRDAARQARKKAKLVTVIQPSKRTFGTLLQPLQPLQPARATFSLGSGHTSSETLLLPPTPPAFSPASNPNIIEDTNTTTFRAGGSNNAGFFQKSSRFLLHRRCLRSLLKEKIFFPDYQQRPKKDARSDRGSRRRSQTIRSKKRSKSSIPTLQHLTQASREKPNSRRSSTGPQAQISALTQACSECSVPIRSRSRTYEGIHATL